MLSLLRKLVGWIRVPGEGDTRRRDRWVEPSNAVTRAVLDPSAPTVGQEQSLYESIRARYPIPERVRRAPGMTTQAAASPPPRSQPAAAEEQQQTTPEHGKKPERGRAA